MRWRSCTLLVARCMLHVARCGVHVAGYGVRGAGCGVWENLRDLWNLREIGVRGAGLIKQKLETGNDKLLLPIFKNGLHRSGCFINTIFTAG